LNLSVKTKKPFWYTLRGKAMVLSFYLLSVTQRRP
jgi:hypothetical protein